jgi:hypothetical protein
MTGWTGMETRDGRIALLAPMKIHVADPMQESGEDLVTAVLVADPGQGKIEVAASYDWSVN